MLSEKNATADTAQAAKVALVTGSTGFIGGFLVHQLHANGYAVRVFSRRCFQEHNECGVSREDWFTGDLADEKALMLATRGVDAVFHLAGITHDAGGNSKQIFDINLAGTRKIYTACVLNKVSHFLFMSSMVASDSVTSAYARSKLAAERFLTSQGSDEVGPRVTVLRPANVYGAGMRGNISTFVSLIRRRLLPALPEFAASFPLVSAQDLARVAVDAVQAMPRAQRVTVYTVAEMERYTANRIESAVYQSLARNKPGWRLPRSVFYFAAMLAGIGGALGLIRTGISLQLYRNLTESRETIGPDGYSEYKFSPSTTLESEMPKIIEYLRME